MCLVVVTPEVEITTTKLTSVDEIGLPYDRYFSTGLKAFDLISIEDAPDSSWISPALQARNPEVYQPVNYDPEIGLTITAKSTSQEILIQSPFKTTGCIPYTTNTFLKATLGMHIKHNYDTADIYADIDMATMTIPVYFNLRDVEMVGIDDLTVSRLTIPSPSFLYNATHPYAIKSALSTEFSTYQYKVIFESLVNRLSIKEA